MRIQQYFIASAATLLAAVFTLSLPASAQTVAATPSGGKAALDNAIHDYILAHPEILIESLRLAKQRQDTRWNAVVKSVITSYNKELLADPTAPVLGNPAGDATIVEFFDYRCAYCRQVEPSLQALLRNDPKVRLVEKELPILGPTSVYAARVALAAYKQGKQKQFCDALMAKKSNFNQSDVLNVAAGVGLDVGRIKLDMNSPDVDAEIKQNFEIARKLRLNGTPAFIVGTALIPGATDLETLVSMLDDARHRTN